MKENKPDCFVQCDCILILEHCDEEDAHDLAKCNECPFSFENALRGGTIINERED